MQDKRRYGDTERFDSVELEKIQDYTEEATLRVLLNAILGGKSATFGLAVSRDAANTANAPTLLIAAGGAFTPAASGRQDAASTMLLPVNATATDVTYEVCVKVVRLLKDAASPITEIDVASGALQSTTIDKRDYAGIQLGYYVKGQVPSGQGWIVLVEAIVNQSQGVTTIANKRPALHTLLGARPDSTAGSHHTGTPGAAEKIKLEEEVQGDLPLANAAGVLALVDAAKELALAYTYEHINDPDTAHAASAISFAPPASGSFAQTTTNVQAAIAEAGADTAAHLGNPTEAHAASAISFAPPAGSNFATTTTNVQAAIKEAYDDAQSGVAAVWTALSKTTIDATRQAAGWTERKWVGGSVAPNVAKSNYPDMVLNMPFDYSTADTELRKLRVASVYGLVTIFGTVTANQVLTGILDMFRLPPGLRPPCRLLFFVYTQSGHRELMILPDGWVEIRASTTPSGSDATFNIASGALISLVGISFMAGEPD